MVRTMIQLSEEQHAQLKKMAAARGASLAELVRQGVDLLIVGEVGSGRGERKRKALEAAGRFNSGIRDISQKHDEYLSQTYGGKPR